MENLTFEAVKEEKTVLMRWQETVKHMMKGNENDEFDKAELTILNERANLMGVKASFGFLDEANTSFNLVFEGLRQKKFGPSQRIAKLKIPNKIVSFHNVKGCPDEASTWTLKALECLDTNDPTSLVIETLNQRAEAITAKNLFEKVKLLTEKSVALSIETYGKGSGFYAKSLIVRRRIPCGTLR